MLKNRRVIYDGIHLPRLKQRVSFVHILDVNSRYTLSCEIFGSSTLFNGRHLLPDKILGAVDYSMQLLDRGRGRYTGDKIGQNKLTG